MDDTISRRAVLRLIRNAVPEEEAVTAWALQQGVKQLPSAQPELIEKAAYIRGFEQGRTQGTIDAKARPKGRWIDEGFYADGHGAHAFRCSECGGHIIEYDADPFCRWCGADMRQREEEQDES